MPTRIWASRGCSPGWDVPKDVVPDSEGTAGAGGAGRPAGHPRKLAGRQKGALPCPNPPHPQECGCCLEGHHRGDGARRAGPCHCLRGLPHPRRGGHPDRPHLQGADAQEGTRGEDVSPMPRRWGQLSPRLLTLPAGHRAAAEGAGGAAGDGEGAGQGEEAVHPPPAEQRGGQGQGSRRGGSVSGGDGEGAAMAVGWPHVES